jgi:ubiquinone/menaquinone biosynthesis C-methylase UbiE
MLELARANAQIAGLANVEFVAGMIEGIPLADAFVDVVISNCVIALSAERRRVFAEAARVLRADGWPSPTSSTTTICSTPKGSEAGSGTALTRPQHEAHLVAAGFAAVTSRDAPRSRARRVSHRPCG